MDNVAIAKQAYQDFAEGNIAAVVAIMHPEIEWRDSAGVPNIPGDGVFVGPEAVVQNAFGTIPEYYEGFNIEIQELFGSGDKVVMVGYVTGVWKETGKSFKANSVHVMTFKEGQLTHFFNGTDTGTMISPA